MAHSFHSRRGVRAWFVGMGCVLMAAGLSARADSLGANPSPGPADDGFIPIPGEIMVKFHSPPTREDLDRVASQVEGFEAWVAYPYPTRQAGVGQNLSVQTIHPLAYRRKLKIDSDLDVTAAARRVAQLPEVAWAQPNGRTEIALTPGDPLYDQQYGPQMIQCEPAWDLSAGGSKHVVVAVVDTGLSFFHEDLGLGSFWVNEDEIPLNGVDDDENGFIDDDWGWDFFNEDNRATDGHGHGTHVAGIAASHLCNGKGIAGVAGNVTVMPIQVFGSGGGGTWEQSELGFYYAVDNGAPIINYSGGGFGGSEGLREAVEYADARDVTVIAAAGNRSTDEPFYPAFYESVIAVSGIDWEYRPYYRTNFGPHISVTAPAVNILSSYVPRSDSFEYLSGTSMAAPHVAGVAALMLSLDPTLNPRQIRRLLERNAQDVGEPGFDVYFGHGLVNAAATLEAMEVDGMDCDDVKGFKTLCDGGRLKIVVRMMDDAFNGHAVVVDLNGDSRLMVIDKGLLGNKAKLILKDQTGARTVGLIHPASCEEPLNVDCL